MERKQGPIRVLPNRADGEKAWVNESTTKSCGCMQSCSSGREICSEFQQRGPTSINTCYWQDEDSDFSTSTLCEVDGRAFNLETETKLCGKLDGHAGIYKCQRQVQYQMEETEHSVDEDQSTMTFVDFDKTGCQVLHRWSQVSAVDLVQSDCIRVVYRESMPVLSLYGP